LGLTKTVVFLTKLMTDSSFLLKAQTC